jgi:DNA-binding transcriptional ArsR family regulator
MVLAIPSRFSVACSAVDLERAPAGGLAGLLADARKGKAGARLPCRAAGPPIRRARRSSPIAVCVVEGAVPALGPILNLMVQYQSSIDRTFAALADPTRRSVLEHLGARSASISELAAPCDMSLTGMKKHIRVLEEAQLVTTEKVGRVRRCTLVPYAFEGISAWLTRLDRFAQVVERTKGEQ